MVINTYIDVIINIRIYKLKHLKNLNISIKRYYYININIKINDIINIISVIITITIIIKIYR